MVSDVFPTDTTDYADIILPAASFLESNDLFASYFNHSLSAQIKITEPTGSALPNSEIFRRLSKVMGVEDAALYESDEEVIAHVLAATGTGETFASLSTKGTIAMGDTPVILPTDDGRIHLASADGQPLVPEPYADIRPANGLLRLLSPASPWLLNDSFGNDTKVEAQLGEARVALHPEDAARRGLSEGQTVVLHNATGRLQLKLLLDDSLPKGVALSHKGRWPKRQSDQANVNVLNPGEKSDMGDSTCVHNVEVEISAA